MPGYRDSHLDRGVDYHRRFTENPYRRMMWGFEQRFLLEILKSFPEPERVRHLDFACGTGRVLSFLEDKVGRSVGVDVSESMLETARAENPGLDLRRVDITRESAWTNETFDLVTAFRFFPNAETELRREVLEALRAVVSDRGRLVFNNHMNHNSLPYRLMRLRGKQPNLPGMSHGQIAPLLEGAGWRIERTFHAGLLPSSENRLVLPAGLLTALESIASRLPLAGLSTDVLYVCRPRSAVR